MDQRLLAALENLGTALEEIALALQSKEEPKTSSVQALKAGDFGKQLESINIQLKSIKADTQEILKQQKTIQSMSRQRETPKETPMEEIGKDKKKESALKKGIGTILLIAVAVLAIGMAFKLVGKIDFLSVIALGLAMWVVAEAFAKIAMLRLSLKESLITSLTMITMSIAITMSSWILRKISPVSIIQLLTAGAIAGIFAVIGISLEKLATGISVFHAILGRKAVWVVPLQMVAIATAITMSSWVMGGIRPIGALQGITAIFIAATFAVIGLSLQRIATAIVITDRILGKKATWIFPLVLVAIATAITMSSWVMQMIVPIGILQALTAIAISIMFTIIGYTMVQIATAIVMIDKLLTANKAAWLLPLVLVAIATAITISSWVLSAVQPLTLFQFLTALGIALLFAVMSYFFLPIAIGVTVIDKIVGKGASLLIPLVFVAIAIAIMVSSHILAKTADIKLSKILQIALFGVALGLVVLAMLPSVLLVGIAAVSGVGAGAIALGVLMIPLIAGAVAISSHIIAIGKYNKYPSLGWVLAVGLAMTGFAAAVLALGTIAVTGIGAVAIAAGVVLVPLIAMSVVATDEVIRKGKYDKYPSWRWIMSVGATMTGFGAAVVALGALAVTGIGLVAILAGVKLVPMIAEAIVETDKVIATGKYSKYPGWKWIASVGVTMTGFGAAVVALGAYAVSGLGLVAILAGLLLVPMIAHAVVETDKVIAKGKYDKYPGWKWIASVGVTMTGFGAAVVALGALAVTGIGLVAILAGYKLVPMIAESIVETDKVIAKGKYSKYPGSEWALSVGGLMTVFGLAVLTLGSYIVGSLGLGYLALEAGQAAVKIIAQSIVDVAWIFNKASAAFTKGPTKEWAEGVSISLGAFSPIYEMMMKGGVMQALFGSGPSPDEFAKAIRVIAQGIVDAANFFNGPEAKAAFTGGPKKEWAEGVGLAIGAFAPVYEALAANSGWFASGVSVDDMAKAIMTISRGIVDAAKFFNSKENDGVFDKTRVPSKEWAEGVGSALGAFAPVFKALNEDTGWFTSGDEVITNMRNAIVVIAGAISDAGRKLSSLKPEMWQAYPSDKWAKGVANSVKGFMDLFDTMEKRGFTAVSFSMQSQILNIGIKAMADVARILWMNKKYFTVKLDSNFIKNISTNILAFAKLGLALDKLLVTEKTITTTSSGTLGFGGSTSTQKVRERRDLGLIKEIALQMAQVARIFFVNKKFFGDGGKTGVGGVESWSNIIIGRGGNFKNGVIGNYVLLTKWLETFGKGQKKSFLETAQTGLLASANPTGFLSFKPTDKTTGDIVADTALKMIRVARILYQGEKFFKLKIDPNYMRMVGKNMIDFTHIVKKLAEAENSGGFMESIGNSVSGLFGKDPISKIANRMVTLANAYDKLATSLMKLGGAMKVLNISDARMLGGITRAIAEGRSVREEIKPQSPSKPITSTRADAPAKLKEQGLMGARGVEKLSEKDKRLLKQMDEVVKLLKSIDRNVSSVDDFIQDQTEGKYPASSGSSGFF